MALASPQQKYDYLVKLLLRGVNKSGKTALRDRFCKNEFYPFYIPTYGIDFGIATFPLADQGGVTIKVQVRAVLDVPHER